MHIKDEKEHTQYKLDLQPSILQEAGKQFSVHGVKAVKMDDIAKTLGISKRTLYELYETKEALLVAVVERHQELHRQLVCEIREQSDNCMDVLIRIVTLQLRSATQVCSTFFSDISRYPRVAEMIRSNHASRNEDALEFFAKGVEEGYFVEFIDYAMFSKIISNIMDMVFGKEYFSSISFRDFFRGYIAVLMRGFCTVKGLAQMDEFLKKVEEELPLD